MKHIAGLPDIELLSRCPVANLSLRGGVVPLAGGLVCVIERIDLGAADNQHGAISEEIRSRAVTSPVLRDAAFGGLSGGAGGIRIAGGGSKALKELAASYNTLTDAQLKQADEAKQNIEDAQSNLTVFVGKTVGWLGHLSRFWGMLSAITGGGLKPEERWRRIGEWAWKEQNVEADVEGVQKRREAARFAAAQRLAEYKKAMAAYQAKMAEKAAEAQKQADKIRQDAAEKYWAFAWKMADKMTSLVRKQRDLQKGFAEAESARTEMTLGEIAALDPSQLSRNNRWKIGAAQDVEWMREEAKFARLQGNDQYAKTLISRSDELAQSIGGLAASDADPLKSMKEDAAETAIAIKELNQQAKTEGIRIIPTNGK